MYSSSSITWGLKARPGESVVSPMVKWNNGILWEQLERKKQTCHISLRKKKKRKHREQKRLAETRIHASFARAFVLGPLLSNIGAGCAEQGFHPVIIATRQPATKYATGRWEVRTHFRA